VIVSDVLIVGAGVAGLACAQRLRQAGLSPLVLEGSDDVGGRARTDELDGFRLDRGFHVLSTSSLEARLALDYARLDLRPLARGVMVRAGGRFHYVTRPGRPPETTSNGAVALREAPSLSVTPGRELVQDAHDEGRAALPAGGIGVVARQLAEGVDVRTQAIVTAVGPGVVHLRDGERLSGPAVVVATAGLVDEAADGWAGLGCIYFEAPEAPLPGAWLVLGDEEGPIATLCAVTEAAPGYAPAGRTLVAVGVGGGEPDRDAVAEQLERWFGPGTGEWRHLRTYVIPYALPTRPAGAGLERPARLAPGLYACGDHRERPSLVGALASGRRAAEAILLDLA
jgi:phytoene dehydrogenase-like protein